MAMATGSTLPRSFRPRQDKLGFRWTIFYDLGLRESRICVPRFVGMEQGRSLLKLGSRLASEFHGRGEVGHRTRKSSQISSKSASVNPTRK